MENKQPVMLLTPEFGGLKVLNFNSSSPWFYPVSGFDAVLGQDENGRPMLVKNRGNHYFSTLLNLPLTLWAELMTRSGVFRYTDSFEDPLWVGNDVVFLHARTGGQKQIRLPKGTRMRAIIGPLQGTLESLQAWEAVSSQTYGFIIEKS